MEKNLFASFLNKT